MSTIPNATQAKVNVSANESVDSATINRSSTRLLANDIVLRDYLCNVLSTEFTGGLSGSISLISGGVVGIRSDFLTQIDITDILSGFSLDDLADVTLTSPSQGESLVFDDTSNQWVNDVPEFSFVVSGSFIEEIEYITGFSHTNSLAGFPTSDIATETTLNFTYNISQFTGGSQPIEAENIAGFFIYCQNWGRVNLDEGDQNSGGGAKWETQAEYPDGTFHTILGYRALNCDDDGGIQSTVFVPFDGNCQTVLKLRLVLRNTSVAQIDDQGRQLNYFKIQAISQVSAAKDLTPDVTFEHIKGSVSSSDPVAIVDGDIVAGTLIEGSNFVWSSINPSTTRSNWTDIFPIKCPNNASKTEIEFEGFLANSGNTSLDLCSEGGSTGIAKGTIVIDWFKKTIQGTMMYFGGAIFDAQGGAILSGTIGPNPVQFVDDGFGGLDIKSQIHVTYKRIKSLPIVLATANGTITNNVAYNIRHYNTIGDDERGKLETFAGTTTGDSISHGLTKTPDAFQCHIDGKDIMSFGNFQFTEQANGTDGGLKYRFNHVTPEIRVTATSIIIVLNNSNTTNFTAINFPAGTRKFTAVNYPDNC